MKKELVFGLVLVHLSVQATPGDVLDGKVVSNGTTSLVLRDVGDPNRLWVLPPSEGKIADQKPHLVVTKPQCDLMIEVQKDLFSLYKTMRATREKERDALAAIENATQMGAASLAAAKEKYQAIRASIDGQQEDIDKYHSKYGKQFGGTLTVIYNTGWNDAVAAVKQWNSGFSSVSPIETKNARIFFSVTGSAQDGASTSQVPVIQGYTIQGLSAQNAASQGVGVSENISVELSLTALGACYVRYPTLFGNSEGQFTYGMSINYDYPRSYASRIDASYNLLSIYKYLQKSGSSGGLFSSKSWSETVESNWGEAAFKMNWTEADPQNTLTLERRLEVERALKADLLANLNSLVSIQLGLPLVAAANPGPHGSTVIAEGLEKTCGANPKCAGAAIALRALDAVFGSSGMSTTMEKKLDIVAR